MTRSEIAKREGELISSPSTKEKYEALTKAVDLIEKYDILNEVNRIFNNGLLSPLKLNDDEFKSNIVDADNNQINIRYPYIIRTGQGRILNNNAFNILVRAIYNHDTKQQESNEEKKYNTQPRLYISKGGVITGEYIHDCIITDKSLYKGYYNVINVPYIPVCIIKRNGESYFVVDHREPRIKNLKNNYEIPTPTDEKVAAMRLNLRNYVKLETNKQ